MLRAGDTLRIAAPALSLDGRPIDAENFSILFGFSDQLFATPLLELLYTPDEYGDEYEYEDNSQPVVVGAEDARMKIIGSHIQIVLLPAFTATLRRGSFIYSIRATDLSTGYTATLVEGSVLIRYSPTSDHRNIPYKTYPRVAASGSNLSDS